MCLLFMGMKQNIRNGLWNSKDSKSLLGYDIVAIYINSENGQNECRKAQSILKTAKMTHYNAKHFWKRPKWAITPPEHIF